MRKPKAATPWLRPLFDSGEILGMIWTPPKRNPGRLMRPRTLSREEQPSRTREEGHRGGQTKRFRQGLEGKGQA